jgi:hypothetical protein
MAEESRVPNARQPRVDDKDKDRNKNKERNVPFAIEQAKRDIEAAERELERARESKSPSRIKDAQDDLKEKQDVLARLRKGKPDERKEARRDQAQEYYDRLGPYIVGIVRNVPELRKAVQEAISNNWTIDKFLRDKRVVEWLGDQGRSAKEAIAIEFDPSRAREWEDKLLEARDAVKDLAKTTYNLDLTEETLDRLARRYIYEGWDRNPRQLQVWMAERVERGGERTETITGGTIDTNRNELRDLARRFGLTYTSDWFDRQANNLLNPDSGVTREKLVNDMIREAEGLYPVFAGRLNENYGVRDAANSYISQMSRWLELDPDSVELTDPLLNRALTQEMDAGGQPKAMSLWDFQKLARQDPRWQTTENAATSYTDFGERMLKMFGFRG